MVEHGHRHAAEALARARADAAAQHGHAGRLDRPGRDAGLDPVRPLIEERDGVVEARGQASGRERVGIGRRPAVVIVAARLGGGLGTVGAGGDRLRRTRVAARRRRRSRRRSRRRRAAGLRLDVQPCRGAALPADEQVVAPGLDRARDDEPGARELAPAGNANGARLDVASTAALVDREQDAQLGGPGRGRTELDAQRQRRPGRD